MKKLIKAFGVSILILSAVGCATISSTDLPGTAGKFEADSVFMSAGADWGNAVRTAEFTPGVICEGEEAIEISLPYGETTAAYNFEGFKPNQTVEVKTAVNLDFFMKDSFIYLSYLPGKINADECGYPRPLVSDGVQNKWIDSVGRFAGEPWPDATDHWQTVTGSVEADGEGRITVILMINHYTETPPIVYAYMKNPVASPAEIKE